MTGIQVDWYTVETGILLIARYTGGLVYWYYCEPLFTLSSINFVYIFLSYTPLFIPCGHNFFVHSKRHLFNFVYNFKVTLFILVSLLVFIHHTNAPVGGIAL